jgi:two-component system, cell cycle response regulator DivK
MKNMTVLLIEDDPASRYIFGTALRHSGFTVLEAPTASRAFTLLREHTPDVLVVDIGLPEMDGFAILDRLRADPRTAAIPVVVATVYVFPEDEARARLAGCDVFLKKPLVPRTLVDEVQRLLDRNAAAEGIPPLPSA